MSIFQTCILSLLCREKCRKYSYRKCINSRKSRRSNFSLKQNNNQSTTIWLNRNKQNKSYSFSVRYCEATSITRLLALCVSICYCYIEQICTLWKPTAFLFLYFLLYCCIVSTIRVNKDEYCFGICANWCTYCIYCSHLQSYSAYYTQHTLYSVKSVTFFFATGFYSGQKTFTTKLLTPVCIFNQLNDDLYTAMFQDHHSMFLICRPCLYPADFK